MWKKYCLILWAFHGINHDRFIVSVILSMTALHMSYCGDWSSYGTTYHSRNLLNKSGLSLNIFNYLANIQKDKLLGDRLNDPMWGKVFTMMSKPKPDKTFTMCMAKCSKENWSQEHATQF